MPAHVPKSKGHSDHRTDTEKDPRAKRYPPLVLAQNRGVIEPATHKGASPKVMDERVLSDDGSPACLDRSQAIVVVFKAADNKSLIQEPDRVDKLPADAQAKADQTARIDKLPILGLAPLSGKGIERGQALVAHINLLLTPHEIRARAN